MDENETGGEFETAEDVAKAPLPIEDEPTVIAPRDVAPQTPSPASTPVPLEDTTIELPPEAIAAIGRQAAPQRPRPLVRTASGQRKTPRWAYLLTTILVVGLVAGVAYAIAGPTFGRSPSSGVSGCGAGSPCQVANAYLDAFTGANYEKLYSLTSQVSRDRFGSASILHAAAHYPVDAVDYSSAHDYIVHRTQYIVAAADIYSMAATAGATRKVNDSQVTVPARIIMTSSRVGDISEDITIPLRLEHGAWKVDWSPGLMFPQLDSAADPNYTSLVRLITAGYDGQRGTIYDGAGHALALDTTVYQINICPSQVTNQQAVVTALTQKLDLTKAEITTAYQGKDPQQCYAERTITPNLYSKVSAALKIAGIQTQTTIGRVYPYGSDTAAVTGYIGQVSPQDLKADEDHYYVAGDVIGRTGVELWGEQYLRPLKGGKLVIRQRNGDGTDGSIVATIAERQAVNGADVHTTINLAAQQAAMAQLRAEAPFAGGTVAVDPTTGAVLALASNPMYDPNDLSLGLTANEQARLNAENHPFVNRAVQTADPVGSVFKVITLSAALQHGIPANQTFVCTGQFQLPGVSHIFKDDSPDGHGTLTGPQALAPSCDMVYWLIGNTLNAKDPNILPDTAKAFGFGAPTGIVGLPKGEEIGGTVPDPAWLQKTYNAQWSAVDAVNLAIGQGYLQATPAQTAMATAAIANNGVRMQPLLVSTVTDTAGATVFSTHPTTIGQLPLSSDNLSVVQVAMLGPVHNANGTTSPEFVHYPINVAGKTGTAESGGPHPDAWFVCYAPASPISGPSVTPVVAIGALVEYSSTGEKYAVPVTKAIMDSMFGLPQGT